MKTKLKPLSSEELAYFCNQLALVLKSGVNLNDGLLLLLEDVKDNSTSELLYFLSQSIDEQKSLYSSLEETNLFSEYFISMVKIGEISGHLEKVLEGLSVHYMREANLKSSVKSSIMHPAILLAMMGFVILVLLLKVIPVFTDVFMQINSQLDASSSAAIAFSSQTGIVVLCIIGVLFILGVICYLLSFSNKGKRMLFSIFSKFIFLRDVFEKASVSRFCSAMSLMISSGFDTTKALTLSKGVVDNPKIIKKINSCEESLQNQVSFAASISDAHIFPPLYSQMIKVSYKSGMLDTVWKQISDKYEDDVNSSLSNLVSFIEPLLVGTLTIIIGIILISVLLPLMGIMSAIG